MKQETRPPPSRDAPPQRGAEAAPQRPRTTHGCGTACSASKRALTDLRRGRLIDSETSVPLSARKLLARLQCSLLVLDGLLRGRLLRVVGGGVAFWNVLIA